MNELHKLEEKVYQAIGHASLCWSKRPKGVFDSEEASKIAKELIKDIHKYVRSITRQ